MEWNGMEWNGMEWIFLGCIDVRLTTHQLPIHEMKGGMNERMNACMHEGMNELMN